MLKQLSLWPIPEESPQTQEIWQALDQKQQQQVTLTLAHLIRKIVYQKNEKQTKEASNE